ncbi:MAG: GMC family oxidoreductase [Gemmatimonadaceae bacterium]
MGRDQLPALRGAPSSSPRPDHVIPSLVAAQSPAVGAQRSADVVIVGAGIVGALMARRLAGAGASVLVLEAGPRLALWQVVERFRDTPYKDDNMAPYPPTAHAPHPQSSPDNDYLQQKGPAPYDAGYIRAVGGTTWHWTGQAWRFLPNDFKVRSLYGVGVDWPITYDTLEPWYYEAEVEMGVAGPDDGSLGSPRSKPYPMAAQPLSYYDRRIKEILAEDGLHLVSEPQARNTRPYDGRPTCCGNNNCSPICPIDAQFTGAAAVRKAEAAGATVLANAVVYYVEADARGVIQAVHYKEPNGQSHRVTGKYFVLAANGIETPKLMLISTSDRFPQGVGNSSGLVGCNLCDHVGTSAYFYGKEPLWPGRGPMRLSCLNDLRDGPFRAHHAAIKLNFSNASPYRAVARELIAEGYTGDALDRQIRDRVSRRVTMATFLEQMPAKGNCVVPSATERDALGIPKPEIHYAIDDYVRRAAAVAGQYFARVGRLMGATEVHYGNEFEGNNHMTGTLLMGNDPATSVVDANSRAHDHPNLFLASTGVMPTTATVNSTLTAVALALRAAAQIQSEL